MIVSEVANGGIQYRPFIVSRIDNLDGTPYKIFAPEQVGTLSVSKSTLDLVREGMRNVAEESGTAGSLFAGFPIRSLVTTGTAENFGGTDHGWFVAYAPYEHPRIVIAVLTEQGGSGPCRPARLSVPCWKPTSTSVNTPKAHRRIKTRTAKKRTTRPIRMRRTGRTAAIAMGLSLTDKS